MAMLNTLLLTAVFSTAILATSQRVTDKGLGALNAVALPYGLKVFLAVVFLNFMLYVWHFLNHEVPLM